jgi:hypothetical protein
VTVIGIGVEEECVAGCFFSLSFVTASSRLLILWYKKPPIAIEKKILNTPISIGSMVTITEML